MSFAAPLIAISLVIAVIGAAIAVAPRARRTMFVATVGCATVALAALQPLAQRVGHTHTHAMQAARKTVGTALALVELTARMHSSSRHS